MLKITFQQIILEALDTLINYFAIISQCSLLSMVAEDCHINFHLVHASFILL